MAEYRKISDFSKASAFADSDYLLISKNGVTYVITGSVLKSYAKNAGIEAAKINAATIDTSGHLKITTTDGTTIDCGVAKGADGDDGADGVSIAGAAINAQYHLILTLSNGNTIDAGYCRGASGSGTGDMLELTYDPDGAVAGAGGIPAYSNSKAIDASLTVAGWSSKQQTVSNTAILASGFRYVVAPAYASIDAYNNAKIRAKDVTTDGSIVFTCETVPTVAIAVQILRVRV